MQLFAILKINSIFHFSFFQASEEQILGAGSGPSESEGVKTNSKEVGKSKLKQTPRRVFPQFFFPGFPTVFSQVPPEDSILAECRMLSANKESLTEV